MYFDEDYKVLVCVTIRLENVNDKEDARNGRTF